MAKTMQFLRASGLKLLAVLIAIVLWVQVHGQGIGSLSMDVPLQVQGLPSDMVIVNDLPDHVRITLTGLQARLSGLEHADLRVPLDASGLKEPGVVERALKVSVIRLPVGLTIEKLQPDRLQLQVDRVIKREIAVKPRLELPEGWKAVDVRVTPAMAVLSGPEVWLDALSDVETTAVLPEAKVGPFEMKVGVESPTGKGIRLVGPNTKFTVRGRLLHELKRQRGKK